MNNTFSVRNVMKTSLQLIKKNFWGYIIVIIGIEAIGLLLINEFGKRTFNIALLTAKVDGITNNNFMVIFKNPITLLLLLSIVIISAVFIVLQITITNYYASRDYNDDKTMIKTPFSALKKIKPSHLIILIIYVFLIMPNGNLGVTSGVTSKIHLPRFIVDALFQNTFFTIIYVTGIIISFYLNLRLFYTFAIFTNEKLSFIDSMKKSFELTKKNQVRILLLVVYVTIISLSLILITYALNFGIYKGLSTLIPKYNNGIRSILQEIFVFMYTIILSTSTILLIQVTVVSYQDIVNKQLSISPNFISPVKKMVTISLGVLIFLTLRLLIHSNKTNPNLDGGIKIVSHRGESVFAIENTLESLTIANTHKPDYVEIDIQQTKDHEIVVFHDYNLRRLAGRNERINSLTWNQIKDIEIKNNNYTSKIASFDQYLELARNLNQPLMVEIKTTSLDSDNFIDVMMDKIIAHNMLEIVIFQSLDINIITKLKEKYPETTTGYIIGFALGGIENYNVDFYSIESFSITSKVLSDIERYNKSLFIWTVNDAERMQIYVQSNIAGIITDDVELANSIKKEYEENSFSLVFWRLGNNRLLY